MPIIARIALVAVLSAVLQLFLPWWVSVAVAFGVEAAFGGRDRLGFFPGFYGIAIPWMTLAAILNHANEGILAARVLALFKLPEFPFVLVMLSGIIGGIIGGIASMAGSWTAKALKASGR